MNIIETEIAGLKIIEPVRHGDDRGFLSEVYREDVFLEAGIDVRFVQDNHSYSKQRGVVRGLHYQLPPFAQPKLVRVTRGAIYDVVVDVRRSSSTFGQHVAVELSAENWRQLFVPQGMAHGFATLTDETEVQYKVGGLYSKDHERGVLATDPSLGINWPIDLDSAVLSNKDTQWPTLADQADLFD